MSRLPKAFSKAFVDKSRVYFKQSMSDDDLVQLMQWKASNDIDVITPHQMRKLYKSNLFTDEIKKLFKNSGLLGYLL